ncbi:hypothetical protein ABC855_g1006 [[Candida] zeylanoides]|jgi:hypothetical protein
MFKPTKGDATTWIYSENTQPYGLEKLKGWHKTSVTHTNDPRLTFDSSDTLDLSGWRYHQEVAIVEHSEPQAEAKPEGGLLLGGLNGEE